VGFIDADAFTTHIHKIRQKISHSTRHPMNKQEEQHR